MTTSVDFFFYRQPKRADAGKAGIGGGLWMMCHRLGTVQP
jgi:hypothetical protein